MYKNEEQGILERQNDPRKERSVSKRLLSISELLRSSSAYKAYRSFRNSYKNKIRGLLEWIRLKKLLISLRAPLSGLNGQKRDIEIIVSLTTFPERVERVCFVLWQMLSQTLKPDRVLLYLAEEQFPNRELPRWTKYFRKAGVEFVFCKDLKPHKKYFYAMQTFPDAVIITVDDDLHYPADLVETLYKSYLKFPDAISARRTHEITFDDEGHILPYAQWNLSCSEYVGKPMMRLFATSGGGTLFPPQCLHPEVFNEKNLTETCLLADDLWLKVMSALNGTPTVLAETQKELEYIMWTQETALWRENVREGGNDIQLQKILGVYNDFLDKDNSVEQLIRH